MTDLTNSFATIRRRMPDGAWMAVIVILAGLAIIDPDQWLPNVQFALSALGNTAPYILVAIALIGYLKATGAEAIIARAFEGRQSQMIVLAAIVGGVAPFCSCEVIPFVAGLLAVGVPLPAVMAFWLTSPLIDPPSLMITAAALGWDFAIAKSVLAILLGLFGGFTMAALTGAGLFQNVLRPQSTGGCGSSCGPSPFDQRPVWKFWHDRDRRNVFATETRANGLFLLKWLSLAYLVESLMVHYIPAEQIAAVVGGDGILPIIISAFVGVPAYLNSYAAPALVDGLMTQGMSAGAAMTFMIAGAVSSIPAMTAVWSLVKPRVFVAYAGLGLSGAILSGIVFGAFA